ncbi:MAG: hypothetical protein AAFX93_13090 [Verrucomicrobiota bacterium]
MKNELPNKQWLNKQLKDELFIKPANSLIPMFFAVPLTFLPWVINRSSPWLTAAGLGLGLLSLGAYLTRVCLTWGNLDAVKQRLLNNVTAEIEAKASAYLQETRQRLTRDQDPRTEQMFDRLLQLQKALKDELSPRSTSYQVAEIMAQSEVLIEASVSNLEQSWSLWNRSEKTEIPELRAEILAQRTALLNDTEASIQSLEKTIISFIKNQQKEQSVETARIREELESQLEISERVKKQIESWENPDYHLKH